MATATTTRLITAEEFAAMPERKDGAIEELIRGEIVVIEPINFALHGLVCANVGYHLSNYAHERKNGWATMRAGFIVARNPDTVRGPDLAFYGFARVPKPLNRYVEVPPDLAIEVLAPYNSEVLIRGKIEDYVSCGVRLVWIVDPASKSVMAYSGSLHGIAFGEADMLDGGDVLPGFTCKVADFFG